MNTRQAAQLLLVIAVEYDGMFVQRKTQVPIQLHKLLAWLADLKQLPIACSFMQHLHAADPSVAAHLQQQKVDAQFFAFRWMTVLFAQDVDDMATIWRLWDFILGDASGCKDAIMRLCCALILVRFVHLHAQSFTAAAMLLQSQVGRDMQC